ncbi:MAG TPA: YgcG family protein [Steroidobacteraceae bacterium]|nr:YgcG family protein [Steroidobacteraceae bacterium]
MRLNPGFVLACALVGGALGLALPASTVHAQIEVPALQARVTDLTGTLTAEQVAALEQKLRAFEERKGSQLAVLIVPSTEPEDIAGFGIRVADAWKLGRKGVDDGAILLVAKDDRRMRIEVGRGLEGPMPDAIARRIVDDTIAPLFKQGDFYGGINAGLDQMIRVVDGEPLPAPDHKWSGPPSSGQWLTTALILVVIAASFLRAIFGRTFGAVATGGVSGLIAYVITHVIPIAAGIAALGFFIALLFGGFGGPRGWSNRGRGGIGGWGNWGGGGFGGGGSFGGGGGFSGGGGGFGGGGASGSW